MSSLRTRIAALEGILWVDADAERRRADSLARHVSENPSIPEKEIVAIWDRTVGCG